MVRAIYCQPKFGDHPPKRVGFEQTKEGRFSSVSVYKTTTLTGDRGEILHVFPVCGSIIYVLCFVLVLVGTSVQDGSSAPGKSMAGTVGLFARSVAAVCLYRQNLVLGRFNVSVFPVFFDDLVGS